MRTNRTAMREGEETDRDGVMKGSIEIPTTQLLPAIQQALAPVVERAVKKALKDQSLKELYTPAEVAEILNVSRSQVYKLVSQNIITSTGEGRSVRIPRTTIDEYINSNMREGKF